MKLNINPNGVFAKIRWFHGRLVLEFWNRETGEFVGGFFTDHDEETQKLYPSH